MPRPTVIAATALEHGLDLATLNVRHFPMFDGLAPPYRRDRAPEEIRPLPRRNGLLEPLDPWNPVEAAVETHHLVDIAGVHDGDVDRVARRAGR